jgi:hypothetical protein
VNANLLPVLYGALLTAGLSTLAWWLRRTDRAARLTNDNIEQMRESLGIIDALKHDVWEWEDWARTVKSEWFQLQETLKRKEIITEIHNLPPVPRGRFQTHDNQGVRREQRRSDDANSLDYWERRE